MASRTDRRLTERFRDYIQCLGMDYGWDGDTLELYGFTGTYLGRVAIGPYDRMVADLCRLIEQKAKVHTVTPR